MNIQGAEQLNDIFIERKALQATLEEAVFDVIQQKRNAIQAQHPDIQWNDTTWEKFLEFSATNGDIDSEEFAQFFTDESGVPDMAKIDTLSHMRDIVLTARTYSPIVLERMYETDHNESLDELNKAIHEMKALGYSFDEAVDVIKSIKLGKAGTVHPTEHHNELGIRLDRALVAVGELPTEERMSAFKKTIAEMVDNPIGATRKNTIMDEIDGSNFTARIHNKGCSDLERYIGDFFEQAYGRRPEVKMDIGMKSWDYDSDGKNNAEGWAMMVKMATTTMGSFDDILAAIDTVPFDVDQKAVAEVRKNIQDAKDRLQPLYDRSREITEQLAGLEPKQRAEFYEAHYEEFKQKAEEFSHIYDGSDAKGRGRDTYTRVLHRLDVLRKKLSKTTHEQSYLAVDSAFRDARRNGFALEKGQTRQNDIIHARIIDNFFASDFMREQDILSEDQKEQISNKGGISKLSTEDQYTIYQQVIAFADKNGNREALLQALFDANPLGFEKGGNGYPKQERTLLDRFALRALYPLKFDQAIISDASEAAVPHQKFLADLFKMKDMRHMPLFEDRMNLSRIGDLSEIFHRHGGQDGVTTRHKKSQKNRIYKWYNSIRDIYDLPLMVPCSDSTRGAGSGALMETTHEIRKVVRNAYKISQELSAKSGKEIGQAFAIMIGGGLSMGRFGADVGYMRRVIEQEIKEIAKECGRPFDRNNRADSAFMRMAGAILYTEQGRAKRMFTATPSQVTDDYAGRITEIIRGRFDLEGLVPDNTFIEPKFKYTNPAMEEIAVQAWKIAIDAYVKQRFLPSKEGGLILDNLAKHVTCAAIVDKLNDGARPGAKKTGDRKMTGVRAIENDERNNASELFTSGYGMGAVMEFLQAKLDEGIIYKDDIAEMFRQPEWDFLMFTKEIANAKRIDYDYAFKKLDALDFEAVEEKAYVEELQRDHMAFMESLNKLVDIEEAFPAAMEIAEENKAVMPGLQVFRMVNDYVEQYPMEQRPAVIEKLGGDKIVRALGSMYRAGTAPHYPLFMGFKNAYTHKVIKQDLNQIMTPKARQSLGFDGENPNIVYS